MIEITIANYKCNFQLDGNTFASPNPKNMNERCPMCSFYFICKMMNNKKDKEEE